ncbi:hypothetical protein CLOP_g20558 [Closterium sp. NIES-67]|nr:hypothetical protein CLOP_g20558 [Closterium sp. NIES-67]
MAGILLTPQKKPNNNKASRSGKSKADQRPAKSNETGTATRESTTPPKPSTPEAPPARPALTQGKLSPTAPEFKSEQIRPLVPFDQPQNLPSNPEHGVPEMVFDPYPGNGFLPQYYYDYSGGFMGEPGSVPPEQWEEYMRAVGACGVNPDGSPAAPPVLPIPVDGQGEAFVPYAGSPPLPFNGQFYAPHAFPIQPPIYPPPVLPPPAGAFGDSRSDGPPLGFVPMPGQVDMQYGQVPPPGYFLPYQAMPDFQHQHQHHPPHSPLLLTPPAGPPAVLPPHGPSAAPPAGAPGGQPGAAGRAEASDEGSCGGIDGGMNCLKLDPASADGGQPGGGRNSGHAGSNGTAPLNAAAEQFRGPRTSRRRNGKVGEGEGKRATSPSSDGGSSTASGNVSEGAGNQAQLQMPPNGFAPGAPLGDRAAGAGGKDGTNGTIDSLSGCCLQVNRPDMPVTYALAKFFVIKSFSEDDVHKSIKYNVWTSTPGGNKRLHAAFQEASALSSSRGVACPLFLFFSVNASGQFCGVAEMVSPVDFHRSVGFWQEEERWNGRFNVRWHIIKDVPNALLRHIAVPANDNKPVTNSRDTQEVPQAQGQEMLAIFRNYATRTSILDDFTFYDTRQRVMHERRVARQQQQGQGGAQGAPQGGPQGGPLGQNGQNVQGNHQQLGAQQQQGQPGGQGKQGHGQGGSAWGQHQRYQFRPQRSEPSVRDAPIRVVSQGSVPVATASPATTTTSALVSTAPSSAGGRSTEQEGKGAAGGKDASSGIAVEAGKSRVGVAAAAAAASASSSQTNASGGRDRAGMHVSAGSSSGQASGPSMTLGNSSVAVVTAEA